MPSPMPQVSFSPMHLMVSDLKSPLSSRLICTQVLLPATRASAVQGAGHFLCWKLGTQIFAKASFGSGQPMLFFPHGQEVPSATHWVE
eukprot:Skav219186  [mRNA]  locus=scaffold648:602921:604166:+ [translate_table: standard]